MLNKFIILQNNSSSLAISSFKSLLDQFLLSTECTAGMVEGDLKWSAAMELKH